MPRLRAFQDAARGTAAPLADRGTKDKSPSLDAHDGIGRIGTKKAGHRVDNRREQTRVPLYDRADVPEPDARPREVRDQPYSPGDAVGEGVAGHRNDGTGGPLGAPPRRPADSRARSSASSRPPLPFCGCPTAPAADPVGEISADLFRIARARRLRDLGAGAPFGM